MGKYNILTKRIESISNSRMLALDIARLLAMLMMVQGHTVFCLMEENIIHSQLWYWQLWTFVRGLTAPVFLMVSGAVHIFANKRNENGDLRTGVAKKRIKTCLILLAVGFLMQLPVKNLYDLPFISVADWLTLFKVNVLQMFSVSIFFLTLLYVFTKSNKSLAGLVFVISNIIIILTPFVISVDWYEILHLPFAGFFSVKYGSIFPLFPFTAYLLIGTFIGYLVQLQPPEKRTFYVATRVFFLGILYLLVGPLAYWFQNEILTSFASVGGFDIKSVPELAHLETNFLRAGLGMIFIGISAWICLFFERLRSLNWQKVENIISMFSKRSLFIYVIHLLIIYGSPVTPGLRHFLFYTNTFTAFYCAFFVIFMTMLIVYIYERTFMREIFANFYKYFLAALLIYMLFI